MTETKKKTNRSKESQELALHYMKTLVEVARESFLILDSNLRVVSANPTFYENFQVSPEQTENVLLYELGNGQWNIPILKSLLEEILPMKKVVKDYEVKHLFQKIGEKTILLNARQIDIDTAHMIVLAMEDITVRKELEQKLAEYTSELELKVAERTREIADRVRDLESLNQVMVGRELKMIELKKELTELRLSAIG
ncbi:MAG: PAS domain-containing protein [Candidatus Pacebacteria bacterium]|nr:PAS domain-containing protein [Candidatus Paceibacterota bacterium]MBP9832062.1 PAS domain-containing protein [Candidatus Paceibacterota bacterium]